MRLSAADKLALDIAKLHVETTAKVRGFIPHASWKKSSYLRFKKLVRSARRSGVVEVLYRGSELQAAFILYNDTRFGKLAARDIYHIRNFSSVEALRWMKEKILSHRALYPVNNSLGVSGADKKLRDFLLKRGFHIQAIILEGKTGFCLKNLRKKNSKPVLPAGLRLERLKTKKQLEEVLALEHRIFRKNPEYGFYSEFEETVDVHRKEMLGAMKNGDDLFYVFLDRSNKILGFFGGFLNRKDPLHGSSAGVSLVFDEKIQGKGLSKLAYHTLLEDLVKEKISVFTGGTSQKSVMKVSKLMGRKAIAWCLRYGEGKFPPSYFRY